MRFLIDRCAGRRLAEWLREQGHDVSPAWERGPDPGDRVLLGWAADEQRILVTIDTDFGELLFVDKRPHCGLIRLPDVPAAQRIELMKLLLERYTDSLENGAVVTVRSGRVRLSYPMTKDS